MGERNSKGLPNPITLNIYPGESGKYTMYLDDGISRASEPKESALYDCDDLANSEYRSVLITHSKTGSTRQITLDRKHDNYQPKEDFFFVAILHDPSETTGNSGPLKSVTIDGQEVGLITGGDAGERAYKLSGSSRNAWYYNENIKISFVKVFDNSSSIKIQAEYNT